MDDDESLALALALSAAESEDQHSNLHPASSRLDTSNDEALARQLQDDSRHDPSNTFTPSGHLANPPAQPTTTEQLGVSRVPVSGKAPGFGAVFGGLKGFAKRATGRNNIDADLSHPRKSLASLGISATNSGPQPPRASSFGAPPLLPPNRRPNQQTQPISGATLQDSEGCAGCGQSIRVWQGGVSVAGKRVHEWCFVCKGCSKPLPTGDPFVVGDNGGLYHSPCHRQAFHPRCSCCGEFLPQDTDGTIRFKHQAFWHIKYCAHHDSDGTPRCHACSRLQPQGSSEWVGVDGRHSCLDCLATMVRDTREVQPLYDDILQLYRSFGMPLPTRPPLILVESAALNEASSRERCPDHGRALADEGPQFHTRGLCLSEEWRTIRTVVGQRQAGNSWLQALPKMQQVESSRWDVTAILVLCALPRLLTGSILAHEVMHAWLRLSGFPRLPAQVEEGLAQLMALQWLERQCPLQGSFEERLQSHLGEQIRSDTTDVYGDGFRAALNSFQQLDGNLAEVLRHVKQTGQLPGS